MMHQLLEPCSTDSHIIILLRLVTNADRNYKYQMPSLTVKPTKTLPRRTTSDEAQKEALIEAACSVNKEKKALKVTLEETKALVASLKTEKGVLASELKATAVERDDLKSER